MPDDSKIPEANATKPSPPLTPPHAAYSRDYSRGRSWSLVSQSVGNRKRGANGRAHLDISGKCKQRYRCTRTWRTYECGASLRKRQQIPRTRFLVHNTDDEPVHKTVSSPTFLPTLVSVTTESRTVIVAPAATANAPPSPCGSSSKSFIDYRRTRSRQRCEANEATTLNIMVKTMI